MTQQNDIVVLHVPFRGNREVTARSLETFIREQMAETNTTKIFGELSFVDIPVCSRTKAPTCMAFSRFKNTRVHQAFATEFNGIYVTKRDRLTISLSSNSPITFSAKYLQNKIAWIDPHFLAQQLENSSKPIKCSNLENSKQNKENLHRLAESTKFTITDTNPATTLITNPLISITDQIAVKQSPAQASPKPTVAEKLEINNLKIMLKTVMEENLQLKQRVEELELKVSSREASLAKEKKLTHELKAALTSLYHC